ncbi:MAG: hypothetical protein ACKPKO_40350, partial [Candidatus Fonsibacter sp.]
VARMEEGLRCLEEESERTIAEYQSELARIEDAVRALPRGALNADPTLRSLVPSVQDSINFSGGHDPQHQGDGQVAARAPRVELGLR